MGGRGLTFEREMALVGLEEGCWDRVGGWTEVDSGLEVVFVVVLVVLGAISTSRVA